MYKKYFNSRWKTNPLFNNAAQALEILYAFERTPEIINEMLKLPDPAIVEYKAQNGAGTGTVEAPRGLLIHSYEITDGLVSHTDIITPTAQNADDIERYCYIAAQTLLDKGEEDKIRDTLDLVVRSYDPCISCSVHMADVQIAPDNDWVRKLEEVRKKGFPIFIGVGNRDQSDDGAGIELALGMKEQGVSDVFLEEEIEEKESLWSNGDRPLVFLDAVHFNEDPGKVSLIPLAYILHNAGLSHRFLPFITAVASYRQLKNSYVLGIQPASVEKGRDISTQVHLAIKKILNATQKS